MTYSKTTWVNDAEPALDADHLNNIETGVAAAHASAAALDTRLTTAEGSLAATPTATYVDTQVATRAPLSGVEGVKVHDGSTGGGTRPTGYARVRWVGGTARPTNMLAGDVWEHDA